MRRPPIPEIIPSNRQRLPWIALGIALALVIARASMHEYLHDALEPQPNSKAVARFTGPAAGVGLDLLLCVPALLVLFRRTLQKEPQPAASRSVWAMAALGALMFASVAWASDRFSALVLASHWCAATAALWAASQLVRDWTTFRLVIAVTLSLLPVYLITAIDARFQTSDNVKYFEENRAEVLTANGLEAGSFAAEQFEKKLRLGESFGFFTSPNTFGGVASFLLVAAIGTLIQTVVDKDKRPWALVTLGVLIVAGFALLALTRSRGAGATLILSLLGFLALWRFRGTLAAHSKRAFIGGIVIVALAFAAVIGHGLAHGRLPTDTLTFRWKYWVGAARTFTEHPLRGVGWGNFGLYYLAHRLPSAPEEIKDPHNFLVRFFVELGIVGGVLCVGWLVALWRDLTRPTAPSTSSPGPGAINFVAAVAIGATAIYLAVGVDWAHDAIENFLLIRLLFVGVMILAGSLVALRSITAQTADDRPAPWTLYGVLLALAGMLIHNLIDFSLFETGPMFLFALFAGAALGMRPAANVVMRRPGRWLALGTTAWIAAAMLIWLPLVAAGNAADDADDAVRLSRFNEAVRGYDRANAAVWHLNADYPLRAASWAPGGERITRVRQAVRENPRDVRLRQLLADSLLNATPPDVAGARAEFETALRFDPNNVPARLRYADELMKLGDRATAVEQYQLALRFNDLLDAAENKRLTKEQIADVKARMEGKERLGR